MASFVDKLFNVDFLTIKPEQLRDMQEVTSLAIYESNSKVYDPKGLFSEVIFGQRDTATRFMKPGYIDLKMNIIHPFAYKILIGLDPIFDKVASGKIKASFNNELKTFIEDPKGETGFDFFMRTLPKVEFDTRTSKSRSVSIEVVKKALRPENLIRYFYVLPAGMRDIEEDSKGRPTQDEINNIYSRMIMAVNGIRNNTIREDRLSQFDPYRYRVQNIAMDIFFYIKNLIDGKRGFMQAKWASRGIMDGTRNVLTALPNVVSDLKDPNKISFNDTTVGLYQFVKSILPLAIFNVNKYFIFNVATPASNNVTVIDSKTMKTTFKTISSKDKEAWTTAQGLNNIFNKLKQDVIKNDYAKIGDDYIALVEDRGKEIYVIKDTNNIPAGVNVSKLRPITYGELIYISVAQAARETKGTVTRYPVINLGSIYPSGVYLKTTVIGRKVKVYIDNEVMDLPEYPVDGEKFMGSLAASVQHLGALGGDYDGDSCIGCIHIRTSQKSFNLDINNDSKVYSNSLVSIKDFPHGELMRTDVNKEYYMVPENIEVLTVWNGETKWVHPESYSVHKNLNMLDVKLSNGTNIHCSDEHSIVTVDENLNYTRSNPVIGMSVPILKNSFNTFIKPDKTKYSIRSRNQVFALDDGIGYLYGAMIGKGILHTSTSRFSLINISNEIGVKITNILEKYGYDKKPNIQNINGTTIVTYTWEDLQIFNLLKMSLNESNEIDLPSFWCKTSSRFKWGLLNGLLDTNGTIAKTNVGKNYLMCSATSQSLAFNLRSLIYSLDMAAEITVENGTLYIIKFTTSSLRKAVGKLHFIDSEKQEMLARLFSRSAIKNNIEYTPNIPLYKLQELKEYLDMKHDKTYSFQTEYVIKRAQEITGGSFPKHIINKIMNKYTEFFNREGFWSKYRDIVKDKKIEWAVVQQVTPLPEITEAYDITCPPYCTFVMENGVVVYDTVSFNAVLTKESVKEIDTALNSKAYYIMPDGSLSYSAATDTLDFVLKHLSAN